MTARPQFIHGPSNTFTLSSDLVSQHGFRRRRRLDFTAYRKSPTGLESGDSQSKDQMALSPPSGSSQGSRIGHEHCALRKFVPRCAIVRHLCGGKADRPPSSELPSILHATLASCQSLVEILPFIPLHEVITNEEDVVTGHRSSWRAIIRRTPV